MANIFERYQFLFGNIQWNLVGVSAILFLIGVLLAPTVVEKNLRLFLAYPLWIHRLLEKVLQKRWPGWLLFGFIFSWNVTALFLGFAAGFGIVLPPIFALFTGLNVGVVMMQSTGEPRFWGLFLNPVALFELPATWISFSLGMKMGIYYLLGNPYARVLTAFHEQLPLFIWIVIPLLFIAAALEASLVVLVQSHLQNQNHKEKNV